MCVVVVFGRLSTDQYYVGDGNMYICTIIA